VAAQTAAIETAAIGFSPHSGWAAMVVLGGSAAAPELLARSRVQLIDDDDPESKQPYHAVEFLCVEEATGRLDGYMAVATRLAYDCIRDQSEELKGRGLVVSAVGIIDSSSRKQVSLPSILASHATRAPKRTRASKTRTPRAPAIKWPSRTRRLPQPVPLQNRRGHFATVAIRPLARHV
jgi:hypothetical protein